ncbi:hypothetical protein B1F79_02290 [Coxiella-like endosymbiont of Rhipicephalus sanguineus]|nr:hypothetical protein [Coxiella-like endosymbiont of Rhipicephalus sanguineus]
MIQLLKNILRIIIEHKILSLSIYYSLVKSENLPVIKEKIDRNLKLYPQLKKHLGKKVFELRPAVD